MLRNKSTKELEEAHCYIRTYVMFGDEVPDPATIEYLKSRLEKVWADCMRSINYGNGKISALRTGPTGFYERFDAADARIVAKLIKQRLVGINRIIAETPTEPLSRLHNDEDLHTHLVGVTWKQTVYVQRSVKYKQRVKAKRSSDKHRFENATPEYDELLELELTHKERVPHRNGHGKEWIPTRQRYWRPANNNWKQHGRRCKQWNNE